MSHETKKPSGTGYPAVRVAARAPTPSQPDLCRVEQVIDQPVPVVLTSRTLLKLVGGILVPVLGAISIGLYHYHATKTHMDDPTIHLTRGERGKLETKSEAHDQRKAIVREIKRHQDVKIRELKVEQREQIQKGFDALKVQQRTEVRRLVTEVRRAGRRRAAPASPP